MIDKSNKNKSDDKYNIRWDINSLNSSSATELTGLIPSAPTSDDEVDSYNDIMTYRSENIVAEGNEDNQKNQTLYAKKTVNNTVNNFKNKKND